MGCPSRRPSFFLRWLRGLRLSVVRLRLPPPHFLSHRGRGGGEDLLLKRPVPGAPKPPSLPDVLRRLPRRVFFLPLGGPVLLPRKPPLPPRLAALGVLLRGILGPLRRTFAQHAAPIFLHRPVPLDGQLCFRSRFRAFLEGWPYWPPPWLSLHPTVSKEQGHGHRIGNNHWHWDVDELLHPSVDVEGDHPFHEDRVRAVHRHWDWDRDGDLSVHVDRDGPVLVEHQLACVGARRGLCQPGVRGVPGGFQHSPSVPRVSSHPPRGGEFFHQDVPRILGHGCRNPG